MRTVSEKLSIHLGALAPKIAQQVRRAGRCLDKDAAHLLQKDADAITRLSIRGLLSEGEVDKARRRLVKEVGRALIACLLLAAVATATHAQQQPFAEDDILAPQLAQEGGDALARPALALNDGVEVEGASGDDGVATGAPASPSPWIAAVWMPLRRDKAPDGDESPGMDVGAGAALHAFTGRWWRLIPAAVGIGRETVAAGVGWVFTRRDAERPAALVVGYAAPYTIEHGIEVGNGEVVIGIAGTIPGRGDG